jgi:hypothetical protein
MIILHFPTKWKEGLVKFNLKDILGVFLVCNPWRADLSLLPENGSVLEVQDY